MIGFFTALYISITMQAPMEAIEIPDGRTYYAVQCVDCEHWYLPSSAKDLKCKEHVD